MNIECFATMKQNVGLHSNNVDAIRSRTEGRFSFLQVWKYFQFLLLWFAAVFTEPKIVTFALKVQSPMKGPIMQMKLLYFPASKGESSVCYGLLFTKFTSVTRLIRMLVLDVLFDGVNGFCSVRTEITLFFAFSTRTDVLCVSLFGPEILSAMCTFMRRPTTVLVLNVLHHEVRRLGLSGRACSCTCDPLGLLWSC